MVRLDLPSPEVLWSFSEGEAPTLENRFSVQHGSIELNQKFIYLLNMYSLSVQRVTDTDVGTDFLCWEDSRYS